MHVRWHRGAAATPHGQLVLFAEFLAVSKHWVEELGHDPADYGTHSMRRTKATLIYRRTKSLRAVQLLLGHRKLESTVRYLGIEVDDALEISVIARTLHRITPGRSAPRKPDRIKPHVRLAYKG